MNALGNGLYNAEHYEDALSVHEAELSVKRRLGATEYSILVVQSNLATTYADLGRIEEALRMRREVYTRTLKLFGEAGEETLVEALNYAADLANLNRFEEARSLLRRTIPAARRVLGDGDKITLTMRLNYARPHPTSTLDDLREAVTTLEDSDRIARRVLGGEHPLAMEIDGFLRKARATLRARETPSTQPS